MPSLEEKISYTFTNKDLLKEALSHPSLSSEQRPAPPDNQRLEFLGDAVLELVITHYLFHQYPDLREGQLTKLRAQIVSKPTLALAAKRIDLGSELFLSNGEDTSGGRTRDSNLADAFESLLGAIHIDQGLDAARQVILTVLAPDLDNLDPTDVPGNAKGELQETLQSLSSEPLAYQIISQEGPPHDRIFTARILWKDRSLGEGTGNSKKIAETAAAKAALKAQLWK